MSLKLFVSNQMLSKRLYPAFTISKNYILAILTDRNGTNTHLILTENADFLFECIYVPNSEVSRLISTKNFFSIWMKNCTIYGFVLFHLLRFIRSFCFEVKNFKIPIFTACINAFIMIIETDWSDITFKISWIKNSFRRMIWTIKIINFDIVVHTDN